METKWDARDRKRRKRMPVHGKSLSAIINSIRKRSSGQGSRDSGS